MKAVVLEKLGKVIEAGRMNNLKKETKRIIAGIIVIFLIASICAISRSINTSSINISAHFSSVTEGKNPDGSPFNINELLSDEVLESASQKMGGKIDAKTIKKHLSISDNTSTADIATLKQKIVDGNTEYSFYPNVYTLTYSIVSEDIKRDGFFASVGAVFKQIAMPGKGKILKNVAESYSELYFDKYIAGKVAMELDWSDTDSLDYYNKATETKAAAEKVSRFILSKYNNNPEFVSVEGIGYGDLYTEIEQILEVDVNNYMSFVIQNGVTNDKESLLRQFSFMENLHNEKNTRHMSAYKVTKDVVDFYDSNTTKVVFVPALDGERTFYMNRTKVGIDYLIEKASTEKVLADESKYDAERYRYLTKRFSNKNAVPEKVVDATDEMYTEIKGKINDFIDKAEVVISEGSQADEHELLEVGNAYSDTGLVSMAICGGKIFVMLLLIAFLVYSLIEYISRICGKKEWWVKKNVSK